MTRTRWIIFIVLCLIVFGVLIFTNQSNSSTFKGNATKIITQGPIPDHVFGSTAQKVVLIEYGDYECPACGGMYQTVKNVTTQYQNDLTFIFRNFPLTTIHPNAYAGAVAAEAAGLQGKYYEMHDLLYENQNTWGSSDTAQRTTYFQQYAESLGLNMTKFNNDVANNSAITSKINRDQTTAQNFSIDATPTFILDGEKMPATEATNPTTFMTAIQSALRQAGFKA